ncbi:MAG: hypothetical protein QM770_02810 [Tepidisphaeraceae bacterium]
MNVLLPAVTLSGWIALVRGATPRTQWCWLVLASTLLWAGSSAVARTLSSYWSDNPWYWLYRGGSEVSYSIATLSMAIILLTGKRFWRDTSDEPLAQ